ncbi:MAG: PTS sugar transporter subunit IIB [Bifidobacteriaceae bacterium]|nr:PTS sugar transporter subunit IIB [Bifidobacteriaceae bacterium]
MNVLLVCMAGISTSLLVNNMRKFAAPEDKIEARPVADLDEVIRDYDTILLGPQIRFRLAEVESRALPLGKPVGVLDMRLYGTMDGKAAMDYARSLLNSPPRPATPSL